MLKQEFPLYFGADFRAPLGEDFVIGIWASRHPLENP
nr:MAG TPA: hypothetical protein [Caudoviricetes sp.]